MKAAIFDLDGTLLDSMGVWTQIDRDFLTRRGLAVPEDYMDAVASMRFYETAVYTVERFGLSESPDALLREWYAMAADAYGHTVALKRGAKDYLARLRGSGIRLAIATSAAPALYLPALRRHGIESWFEVICTTDEVSRDKSAPDIFLHTAERLAVAPADCVVFEDLLAAIRSAKAAGMTVYGIYDAASAERWAEICRTADGAFHDFTEAPLPDGQSRT